MGHKPWTIYPLYYGEFLAYERSLFVFHKGFGEKIKAPCIGWLVENGEEWILVDTGPWDPVTAKKYHHHDMSETGPEAVTKALESFGMAPKDITSVILTHLHWDHTSNVGLFVNARFYVQRKEAFYALDPLPVHRFAYDVGLDFRPPWQEILHKTVFLEGDTEFRPGLRCCLLPGHTPGSQGVLADTGEGRYLIAGDNVDLQENWDGDEQFQHLPGGIFNDLGVYLESLDRMDKLADVVLPSHDYRVLETHAYPPS